MKELGSYPLVEGGPKRIGLFHPGSMEQLEVRLDGAPIGRFASWGELRSGRTFEIGQGGWLDVQLTRRYASPIPAIDVRHNGSALPGSAFDPRRFVRYGVIYLAILAIANLAVGAWSLASAKPSPFGGSAWLAVATGAALAAFAVIARSRHASAVAAFVTAAGLLAWSAVVVLLAQIDARASILTAAIWFRVIFALAFARASFAAADLVREASDRAPIWPWALGGIAAAAGIILAVNAIPSLAP